MSIENPTLAYFRHFISLFTYLLPFRGNYNIFPIPSILTNKANLGKAQMNVNIYYIKDYQILSRWRGKKTNPIQTQSKPVLSAVEWANPQNAKMNVNLYVIEDYRKIDDFIVQINKPNFQNAKK